MKCYISGEQKTENNHINKVRKIIEKNVNANVNINTDKNDSGNKNRNNREIIIVQRIKQNHDCKNVKKKTQKTFGEEKIQNK